MHVDFSIVYSGARGVCVRYDDVLNLNIDMARPVKVFCGLVAIVIGVILVDAVLKCTVENQQLHEKVKDVATDCCVSAQCYDGGRGPIPHDRVECVLGHLNILLRNRCTLRPYCHSDPNAQEEHAILCDIEACVNQGPQQCTWILCIYIICVLGMCYVLMTH